MTADRRSLWVSGVGWALSASALGAFLWAVAHRLFYPYPLEWMEGAVWQHILRILEGRPLYPPPNAEFTPFIYPPLYYGVCAFCSLVVGRGFWVMRLVSLIATAATLAAIFRIVTRNKGSHWAATMAGGLYLAAYPHVGGWYDLGRVDALQLALLLWAFALIVESPGKGKEMAIRSLAAGLALMLAALTKQSTLIATPFLLLAALARGWRPFLLIVAAGILTLVPAALYLDRTSGGWFQVYVWDIPRGHPVSAEMALRFWIGDLIPKALPALLLGLLAFHRFVQEGRGREILVLLLCAGGLLATGWVSRAHTGGTENVLMPAFAALAILAGCSAGPPIATHPETRPRGRTHGLIDALLTLQFAMLLVWPVVKSRDGHPVVSYFPIHTAVPARDSAASTTRGAFLQFVREDNVYRPGFLFGKAADLPRQAHTMAVLDVLRGGRPDVRALLTASIERDFQSSPYETLLFCPNDYPLWLSVSTEGYAHLEGPRPEPPRYPLSDDIPIANAFQRRREPRSGEIGQGGR